LLKYAEAYCCGKHTLLFKTTNEYTKVVLTTKTLKTSTKTVV